MKIAIAGFGVEGKANLAYFRAKFPDADFTILDQNQPKNIPKNIAVISGENAFQEANDFDLIIRSPGIPPYKFQENSQENFAKNQISNVPKMSEKTKKAGEKSDNFSAKIWSSTNEFFAEAKKRGILTIGITGSKGKGTTSSFIAEILRAHFDGKNADFREIFLLGNIGVPALEILPKISQNSIVVYELSSFQLWDAENSPNIAVLTMIEPDHLDVHENFADYVAAKSNIVKFQNENDKVIFNAADENCQKIAAFSRGEKIPFPDENFANFKAGEFYFGEQKIAKTEIVKLPGEHNLRNATAAIAAVWEIIDGDVSAIKKGISRFSGLPHRLKFVAEKSGVKYYDDSIATTPGSAIAAIKSFAGKKQILILGGKDKGANYEVLGEEIAKSGDVKLVIAIGENREKLATQILRKTDVKIIKTGEKSMEKIVEIAAKNSANGDVVVMTPAAASFDMFLSYQDRGEKFIEAVERLSDK